MSGLPFPFGPMTPEGQAAREKRQLDADKEHESKIGAALPHLYAARDALREARAVGLYGDKFVKVVEKLAVLIELAEHDLRRCP